MENYTQKSNSCSINSRSFLESNQWDPDAFADFCADEYADACADAYADACADAYAYACADAYAEACCDAYADACCDAYADACADAYAYACADAYAEACCDAYAEACCDAYADACCDAYADACCDAYAYACADAYAEACCDAYAEACCDAYADACCDAYADACADAYADACADAMADACADAMADASCDAYADDAFISAYRSQSTSGSAPFAAREPYQQRSLRRPKRKQEEQMKNSAYRTHGRIRTRADLDRTRLGGSYSERYTGGEKRRVLTSVNNTTHNPRRYCSPPPSSSNTKLFVGGLSWSLDEQSLKDAFCSFGKISEVKIIYDTDSGRSRGFGFVHFSKEEDATCAKNAMDGKALSGQVLRISFALERVRREPLVVPRLRNTRNFS